MSTYKLNFVDDFVFDNLPFRDVKEALGCADPKTKTAWVRKSGISVVDQFVAAHEIEELVSRYSDHEVDGIRYKKFKQIAASIIPAVVGLALGPLGPVVAGLGAAASSAGAQQGLTGQINPLNVALSGVGAGLGAGSAGFKAGVDVSKNAGGGLLGQALSGTQSMLGFTPAAASTGVSSSGSLLGQGFQASQAAIPGATTPVSFGGAVSNIANSAANGLSVAAPAIASSLSTPAKFGGETYNLSTSPSSGITPTQTTNNVVSNLGFSSPSASVPATISTVNSTPSTISNQPTSLLKQGFEESQAAIPGATTSPQTATIIQAGQQATNQATKSPSLLQSIFGNDWKKTALGATLPMASQLFASPTEAFTPEQSQLFNETVQMVKQGAQVQLTPAQQQTIVSNYDKQLENARQAIIQRYKYLRPGSDISNDSQLKEALIELESEFAKEKANALASAQLGLSTQQTQMMAELANVDVGILAQKAGIKYQEAQEFKNMLASLGYMVANPYIYK